MGASHRRREPINQPGTGPVEVESGRMRSPRVTVRTDAGYRRARPGYDTADVTVNTRPAADAFPSRAAEWRCFRILPFTGAVRTFRPGSVDRVPDGGGECCWRRLSPTCCRKLQGHQFGVRSDRDRQAMSRHRVRRPHARGTHRRSSHDHRLTAPAVHRPAPPSARAAHPHYLFPPGAVHPARMPGRRRRPAARRAATHAAVPPRLPTSRCYGDGGSAQAEA